MGSMVIDKAFVGSSEVDKIYLGTKLVWPAISNGIYILHTDGKLYTRQEWDTSNNDKAVGVALISDNCGFVIAPEQSSDIRN